MNIETIRIKNFKALQDVELVDLPQYCVFVGGNGTGKTTLFRVFSFLKNCLAKNVRSALHKEGGRNGLKEVVSRGHEGEDIEIEIQFRLQIAGTDRKVTYRLEIGETKKGDVVVKREILRYKRGEFGHPFHFIDFKAGKGAAVNNEEDFDKEDRELEREEQTLESPDTLAIKGLGQFSRFKAAVAFRRLIENWHISDFHISAARGDKEDSEGEHLSENGDNLPAVARHLFDRHPDLFKGIIQKMSERVPGVSDISVTITDDGRLLMKYKDGTFQDPFIDKNVSDGTVKIFAYLVLLADPKPHPILCVEEPENQLHPKLMGILAEEFLQYSERGGQVFISTHSPDFLNAISLESVYWLEKENGTSRIFRANQFPQLRALCDEGDKPGTLWKQGLLDRQNIEVK